MAENSPKKQRGKPFLPGQSGNPAGKPKGTRNRATLLIEQLLNDDALALGKKAIEMAKNGDSAAMRLCLDRIAPPRKDRHIPFALPKMTAPRDAVEAVGAIVDAVAQGELTPSEASEMTRLVESFTRVIEATDHEERLSQLEATLGARK